MVMFVAPIVSITTITVMLFIGAFRQFKDSDMDNQNLVSVAQNGANMLGGGA